MPTAADAVLNVSDLEKMLKKSSVKVSSGSQPVGIRVHALLSWSGKTLTLSAYGAITINRTVNVGSGGGLSIVLDTAGEGAGLGFGDKGYVTFADPASSSLSINGEAYSLVSSVTDLATGISTNPSGDFALAQSYNAKHDRTYKTPPVSTPFSGIFEGLGNSIGNLSVDDSDNNASVGLFGSVNSGGSVNDLRIAGAKIVGGDSTSLGGESVGILVGASNGTLQNDSVDGSVSASSENAAYPYSAAIGGLAGQNNGTISNAQSQGTVTANGTDPAVGGLVGVNFGTVQKSRSASNVQAAGHADAGGLFGGNYGAVTQSYATGAVSVLNTSWVGGFAAFSCGTVSDSYSTGAVTIQDVGNTVGSFLGVNGSAYGGGGSCTPGALTAAYGTGLITATGNTTIGGFAGYDNDDTFSDDYWDISSTNVSNLSQGAGNIPNDPGLTGLTTSQLQSALPSGFEPNVWAIKKGVNDGLPYLIANPPF